MGLYLICALILVLLAVFMTVWSKKANVRQEQTEGKTSADPESMVCCGQHAVCEKQRLIDRMNGKAQYYDDEELDRFKGRASDSYTDEESEEFRYVMYTMQQNEVLEWLESLEARQVQLPDQLKDEAYILINDSGREQ